MATDSGVTPVTPQVLRVAVVMDYQNIHLTAREKFTPAGTPTHHSLIHPLHFANQILIARAAVQAAAAAAAAVQQSAAQPPATPNPQPTAKVELVRVFRGLPSNAHAARSYARSQAQKAEWTRDARVKVTYRPLRYQHENGVLVPREKGVDVLVALELVQLAQAGNYDLLILAAHDTDLEPALELALDAAPVKSGQLIVETAGWKSCKRLRPAARHTFLNQGHFQASRDRKNYL